MTFGEMQASVRIKLNEASATFWTNQDIKDALNEGLAEIADITEYDERQATISMLTGRTYYDLTSILPDTFLSPRRCQNTNTNRWLRPTSAPEQDQHTYAQWENVNGPPDAHWMRGNWWLGVFPHSSSDTSDRIRLYYTAMPAPMTGDSEAPEFPVEFHDGIVMFAISDLLSQSRETNKALSYWNDGMEVAAGLKAHLEGRQGLQKAPKL